MSLGRLVIADLDLTRSVDHDQTYYILNFERGLPVRLMVNIAHLSMGRDALTVAAAGSLRSASTVSNTQRLRTCGQCDEQWP